MSASPSGSSPNTRRRSVRPEANRYPSISLTGDIASSATSIADLGKKSTIGWSFGPSLTVPIFQGGQLKAAVDVAKAQRDQYYVAYQAAVLTAMEDVEAAWTRPGRSRRRRRSRPSEGLIGNRLRRDSNRLTKDNCCRIVNARRLK